MSLRSTVAEGEGLIIFYRWEVSHKVVWRMICIFKPFYFFEIYWELKSLKLKMSFKISLFLLLKLTDFWWEGSSKNKKAANFFGRRIFSVFKDVYQSRTTMSRVWWCECCGYLCTGFGWLRVFFKSRVHKQSGFEDFSSS